MNIIMHYPKNKEDIQLLQDKVTEVHISSVATYIKNMACPKDQKLQLINSIQDTVHIQIK